MHECRELGGRSLERDGAFECDALAVFAGGRDARDLILARDLLGLRADVLDDLVNGLLDTAGYPTSVSPLPLEALRKPAPAAPSNPETK